MQLNLRQIEVFRAVMTAGSISGAAKLLYVSQPAVSRLLSHTEQRLGFSLFERVKGRLYPTPEARQLFKEVEAVYDGVRRVEELANELSEKRSGILHLVSSPSIGHMLIPMAITAFHQTHPEVKVTFQPLTVVPLTQMLLERRADLGAVILPSQHPNLSSEPIGQGDLVVIFPYSHPLASRSMLTIEDLLPYPLVSYRSETPFGTLVEQMFQEAGYVRRVAIEVSSPHNACTLVKAGGGIAIVDEFSAHSAAGDFVVRPIAHTKTLAINLVQSRFEPLSQLAQDFAQVLRDTVKAQGFAMRGH
jgi:DNA-binding transcriptional LysR family regulator